jgi:hypothetical protein
MLLLVAASVWLFIRWRDHRRYDRCWKRRYHRIGLTEPGCMLECVDCHHWVKYDDVLEVRSLDVGKEDAL